MTPEQLSLAGRRLLLGITNVGFWVLAAATGLIWLAGGEASGLGPGLLGILLGVAVAVQAVFDFVGGAWLMPGPRPSTAGFFRGWLRGALVHTLVLAGVGLLSFASFELTRGFCFAILLATAGLAFGRRHLLNAVSGVAALQIPHAGNQVRSANSRDPAFTGGIIGFGRSAVSLLPSHWLAGLAKEELAAETARRRWQIESGLPVRTLLLILGWNLLGGFANPLSFTPVERTTAEAVLGHACWMTLWAFGGLLVLPVLSRQAVFAADRAAVDAGHDPRGWIRQFPCLTNEDGSSSSAVQTIFYPIPSTAQRLRQLERPLSGFVPGNLARNNLYYSWATLTFLGRAVHCNIGRPALWVFPPSA